MILKNENGFIALTSAVVVAALLLVISFSLGMTGFFARFNTLETEYKEASLALAEGCVESARLKLVVNPNYAGNNESIAIGTLTCNVVSVGWNADPILIKTKAVFPQNTSEKAVTNLEVTIDKNDLSVVSWEEVPNHIP